MNDSLQTFVRSAVLKRKWECVGEMIYYSHQNTYISIKCTDVSNAQFEIKEYTTDEAIGECMNSHYSKYLLQHPPHSIESIIEYENKHSIELPRLARIFATYVSSAIFSLDSAPINAYIDPEKEYNGVFDVDDVTTNNDNWNSRIIEIFNDKIFNERSNFIYLVVDGYQKGRVFDEYNSSCLGSTENEVDFFLNSTTQNKYEHIKSIMQYMFQF